MHHVCDWNPADLAECVAPSLIIGVNGLCVAAHSSEIWRLSLCFFSCVCLLCCVGNCIMVAVTVMSSMVINDSDNVGDERDCYNNR